MLPGRLLALPVVALAAACVGCVAESRDFDRLDRAYVSNEWDGTISVLDTRADKVIATWPVGGRVRGLRVNSDGRHLYAAITYPSHRDEEGEDGIVLLDTDAMIPAGSRPWGLALSRDGDRLYTANGLSNDESVIDTRL